MFKTEYTFLGKHAEKVEKLIGIFDQKSNAKLFDRVIDVYMIAPIVGFLYNERVSLDKTKNEITNKISTKKIFFETITKYESELKFTFQLLLLLDKGYEPDEKKRIDKAFRNFGENPADKERFEEYVRGGVDVLYRNLIEYSTRQEDYVNNLYDFLNETKEKFNENIDKEELIKNLIK